jgi:hypothetical protein
MFVCRENNLDASYLVYTPMDHLSYPLGYPFSVDFSAPHILFQNEIIQDNWTIYK